jgi:Domain of unknown function (DUF4136)
VFNAFLKLTAPVALVALSACAPAAFNAQVNRFQTMPAPQGQSYAIKAADPKYANSLEFTQYAGLVATKMTALGYQPAASPASASLIVTMDFGVDQGKERTRVIQTDPFFNDPWYSGYYRRGYYGNGGYYGRGYGRSGYIYGFNDPFLFGSGYDEIQQYTVYSSGLDLKIEKRDDGKRVFEGKAEAISLSNNLTYLVPNLVEAMFTGFPGNSGETVKITVQQPKKK